MVSIALPTYLLCNINHYNVYQNASPPTHTHAHTHARPPAHTHTQGLITQCHYGCVQLLSSPPPPWPRVGLASFAHLLLVEGMVMSYLPVVLSQQFLLSLCSAHVITLLER